MSNYTFRVAGSFELQYTFTDVRPAGPDAPSEGLVPTEAALAELLEALGSALGEDHAVTSISVDVDPGDLLGIDGVPI